VVDLYSRDQVVLVSPVNFFAYSIQAHRANALYTYLDWLIHINSFRISALAAADDVDPVGLS
jgi:hypothetical protein